MQDVEINKEELLEILKQNRESHIAIYEEAVVKYHDRLLERLIETKDRLIGHKAGTSSEPFKVKIDLPVPESHVDDYDRAIRMLELETRSTITLMDFEFDQYVRDQWGWKDRFAANTTSYTG